MRIHHESITRSYTIAKIQKKHTGRRHWHQRMEFAYLLDGQCEITIGKDSRTCSPGDVIAIHSGEIHALLNQNVCTMYICTFDPGMLYHFQSKIQFIQGFISADELKSAGIDMQIRHIFDGMLYEQDNAGNCHELLIRSDILRLYGLLVRHFERQTLPDNQKLTKFENFQNVLRFITEHYAENITLADIAKTINYNSSYVSTLFVAYTGVNFKNYLDSFRIGKAVELVSNTDLTVADIAAQCGYENIRTFNYAFKRITGQSPSGLRKNVI